MHIYEQMRLAEINAKLEAAKAKKEEQRLAEEVRNAEKAERLAGTTEQLVSALLYITNRQFEIVGIYRDAESLLVTFFHKIYGNPLQPDYVEIKPNGQYSEGTYIFRH